MSHSGPAIRTVRGQQPSAAVRRNLAVGPPSVEQIHYGLNLKQDQDQDQNQDQATGSRRSRWSR